MDRLDYSKGLRQRFLAFERFLQDDADGQVVFMQIAPPSRSDIQTYREIRRELEAEAGRINGRFAEVDWMPLRYLNRGFARNVLMPLYAEAQVGLVTPLRDGMNLVAKEYVAAQDPDDPGVLVLSQFAGAAAELTAALIINPYDEAGMAAAMDRALRMRPEERRARHTAMLAVMRRNSLERGGTASWQIWPEMSRSILRYEAFQSQPRGTVIIIPRPLPERAFPVSQRVPRALDCPWRGSAVQVPRLPDPAFLSGRTAHCPARHFFLSAQTQPQPNHADGRFSPGA